MFQEEEDWNDESEAQVLSEIVLKKKPNSSSKATAKTVGKKSLLRTLHTLRPVPDRKSDEHQHDSDSDSELKGALLHKRKKKKRRKNTEQVALSGEQEKTDSLKESVKTEQPVTKKMKKDYISGVPKAKTTCVSKTKGSKTTKSESEVVNTQKLTRQQWKNKMKRKKNGKNKFRQNCPEEEVNTVESAENQRLKEEVAINSCNDDSERTWYRKQPKDKKIGKDFKPQKRKKLGDTDPFGTSQTTNKQQKGQSNESEKVLSDPSVQNRPKQEVNIMGKSINRQQPQPAEKKKKELSKEQLLKQEHLRKVLSYQETETQKPPAGQKAKPPDLEIVVPENRSDSLRKRMEERLNSARFRYINEILYSTSSGEAKRMFQQDPQAFWIYHRGYTAQVQKWPVNPVDMVISYIKEKPASLVVADFGCGDCKIAHSVKNTVHSFDFVATSDLVTVCDMANVPLANRSVDIAVFCLSLMGTNLADFLAEASRVLKMGGILKIAEVASRFDNVRSFITGLASLGFKMGSKDTENSHFYTFDFVKTKEAPENRKKCGLHLKACVYKKR